MEILFYLLKSSSILSLFFVVYEVFLKRDTFFILNRVYLLTGILASIFLPFLTFSKTIVVEESIASISTTGSNALQHIPATDPLLAVENVSFLSSLEWFHFLLIAYGIGILIFLIRFLKSLTALRKILKYRPKSYQENGILFIETDKETNPFTFFKTVVYNPSCYDESELEMILHHEKTHANQWHSADIILGQLFLVFQWMNPIAWIYTKRIDQNLEFIADRKTTLQQFPKKKYQISLLRAAYPGDLSLPVNNFHSFTKIRILMLNKAKSNFINRFKILAVLPLLMLFLMSFQTETITQIKNTPTVETSNDPISKTDIEKLSKILNDKNKNVLINFNGKNKKVKDLLPAFYKIESLQFGPDGLPIIKAEKSEKPNLEVSMKDLPTGLYLMATENYDLVLITRNLKDQNDAMYVFKEKNFAESDSSKMKSTDNDYPKTNSSEKSNSLKNEEFPENNNSQKRSEIEAERKEARDSIRLKRKDISVEVEYNLKRENEEKREELNRKRLGVKDSLRMPRSKEILNEREQLEQQRKDEFEKRAELKKIASAKVVKEERTKHIVRYNENNNLSVLRFEIAENSSDKVLDNMIKSFADAGVDFNYKNVKRNRDGKITRIKMTLNNRKGSQAKVNNQSSNGIGAYILGLNDDGSIYIINKKQ